MCHEGLGRVTIREVCGAGEACTGDGGVGPAGPVGVPGRGTIEQSTPGRGGVGAWGRPGAAKALCTVGSQGREHLAQPWVTVTLTVRAGQAGHRWPCP